MNTPSTPTYQEYSPKIIGHNIRQARERISMKQKDLAELMNISVNTLIAIESGQRDPALGEIHALAKHLKVAADDLLQLKQPPSHNFHNNHQDGQVNIINSGHVSSERKLFERLIADLEARVKDLMGDKAMYRAEIDRLRSRLGDKEG